MLLSRLSHRGRACYGSDVTASPCERIDDELAVLGALLVEERVLRRIIRRDRGIHGPGLHVPHERCYVVPRARLARYVDPDEVRGDQTGLPERVIVVTGDRGVLAADGPEVQTELWRVLFHARVHLAFDELAAAGRFEASVVRERVHRLGHADLDAGRFVLRQESLLLPPASLGDVYVELAALYLELRHFAPAALDRTFPGLDRTAYDALLSLDLDADALLAASRPARAPAEPCLARPPEDPAQPTAPQALEPEAVRGAERMRSKGNLARAAILAVRGGCRDAAQRDLEALTARLGRTFGVDDPAGWADGLMPVVELAGAQPSMRTASSRLLHDLQAACVIADREVKVVDVIGWTLSRGKRDLVRALPAARTIRAARRVHRAVGKLAACAFASGAERDRAAATLHVIAQHADARARAGYRPVIVAALNDAGLVPYELPERVAQATLVDELLDRALTAGQLSLGDLRDALSRNDLKLPDLQLSELAAGDPLLRVDARLARSLDGIYRRGEAYMRALQKLSSLLFGTRIGRVLTRYLLLPLLGAFALLEGMQQMGAPVASRLGYDLQVSTRETLLGGAALLFLLIHVTIVRRGLVLVLRWTWRAIRLLLFDLPLQVWRHRVLRALLASTLVRWGVRPALPATIVALLTGDLGWWRWPIAVAVFAVAAVVTNLRWVARAEEIATDQLARFVRHLGRIVPGIIRLTLEVFARLVELLERGLYRVDEWLRFRAGQPHIVLVLKGAFGVVWFFVTFLVRLYVNLFVEPTVNPIKHFPVVTIAAKIILPFIPAMLGAIASAATPLLGRELANGFAAFTVLVLPGLAGFLVWELKENWRLYRATRSKVLQPSVVGHHGETMSRLLRPGFHSGTIPKLFTKLRRAAWRNDERGVTRAKEGLHHVEAAIATFAARQLAAILDEAEAFRASGITVAGVALRSNRVEIGLACASLAADPVMLRIELEADWLVVGVARRGWIGSLGEDQQRIVEVALAGFYKLAAIQLVHEQLDHVLRTDDTVPPHAITDEGLLVWPGRGFDTELCYDLRSRRLRPRVRGAPHDGAIPTLRGRHGIFAHESLFRTMWTSAWQQIMRGVTPMRVVPGPPLLAPVPREGNSASPPCGS